MDAQVLDRLKNAGLLSEQPVDLGYISTGSFALNKIISGEYTKGIPVGMITQFHGESSSAKTVFATHILKEAQEKGYWSMLVDSENAYNPEFAKHLGIDPKKLIGVVVGGDSRHESEYEGLKYLKDSKKVEEEDHNPEVIHDLTHEQFISKIE